jgi:dTDP-4-amino-4,6-dideoxygalactose transaminase
MNIPFCKVSIGEEEQEAIVKVLKSGWLAAGPETEAFEQEFAEYVGVKYAIFTNSCTSALKMAYKWLQEKKPLATVIYPENTFCATYAAAEEMGLKTWSRENYRYMSRSMMADFPQGIVPAPVAVHYGGIKDETPCLIEDSAHRIEPNDPLVGRIRCYSFYATKNMTTGSGGMFVTNDKEIYERARLYWKDGLTTSTADRQRGPVDYKVECAAGGYDGNDLAASMGRVQLRKLPLFTRERNTIRDRYNAAFGRNWLGNHLYCFDLGTEDRVKECRQYLWEQGIGSGYHYPGTGWTSISLPIFPGLTEEEQQFIIEAMKKGGYVS